MRVVVISGTQDCFTAGNDLMDFANAKPGETSQAILYLQALAAAQKPVIAAVGGVAVGIGTTMLLHCDLVYAALGCALPASVRQPGAVSGSRFQHASAGTDGASACGGAVVLWRAVQCRSGSCFRDCERRIAGQRITGDSHGEGEVVGGKTSVSFADDQSAAQTQYDGVNCRCHDSRDRKIRCVVARA